MPFECIPLMFSKQRDCFCGRSALSAGITAPAISSPDRMLSSEKNYMVFAHCNFLHFSYESVLWLIDWKGFWVLKKEFLVLAGKYMKIFFRLIVISLHVVAFIFHVGP